jgi:prephenate dehydrogenase
MSEDGFNLSEARVAIVGLGLMGGSLAMALKGRCRELVGVDPNPVTRGHALQAGVVQRAAADPADLLPQADVIVLAAPVPVILSLLERLPALVERPCIVLDVGSSKRAVTQAMATLPERFDPLGGHPICGRERLSLFNAAPDLYHEAPFALTPLERTGPCARACALQIIEAIGAHPLWVDPEQHDAWLAVSSHLPFILASALVLATPDEAVPLTGPGFRSTSRLASTPGSMMLGILQTNRDNILMALDRFRDQLDAFETAMRADDPASLKDLIIKANTRHVDFTNSW